MRHHSVGPQSCKEENEILHLVLVELPYRTNDLNSRSLKWKHLETKTCPTVEEEELQTCLILEVAKSQGNEEVPRITGKIIYFETLDKVVYNISASFNFIKIV